MLKIERTKAGFKIVSEDIIALEDRFGGEVKVAQIELINNVENRSATDPNKGSGELMEDVCRFLSAKMNREIRPTGAILDSQVTEKNGIKNLEFQITWD